MPSFRTKLRRLEAAAITSGIILFFAIFAPCDLVVNDRTTCLYEIGFRTDVVSTKLEVL